MILKLDIGRVRTIDEVRDFMAGSDAVDFHLTDRRGAYDFVTRTLRRLNYAGSTKARTRGSCVALWRRSRGCRGHPMSDKQNCCIRKPVFGRGTGVLISHSRAALAREKRNPVTLRSGVGPISVDTFALCAGGVQMTKTHSPYAPA